MQLIRNPPFTLQVSIDHDQSITCIICRYTLLLQDPPSHSPASRNGDGAPTRPLASHLQPAAQLELRAAPYHLQPGYDSPSIALRGACPSQVFRKALLGLIQRCSSTLYHFHIAFMGRHPACPGPNAGEPSHLLRACRTLLATNCSA